MRLPWAPLWACVLAAAASPAAARDPLLGLPIDCSLGEDCFIQNYVDADGGPGAADFTCGGLSYDGHKGTDFAVRSHAVAQAGVNIQAAAPGVVRAVRDGVADHWRDTPMTFPDGQDCGNGLVIDHGGGWETQYCHLREGSLRVQKGQRVAMGAVLGQVGMSGRTEFPHLHLSIRKDGSVVDPFNTDGIISCGETGNDQLWQVPIDYEPGGLLQAGFAPGLPEFGPIKWGEAHAQTLPAQAPALVLWTHVFGARADDHIRLLIEGPGGVFSDKTVEIDAAKAQLFRASGRKLHADNHSPGLYTGTVILLRDGVEIDRMKTSTTLGN
ncbi:M23 family metallopeptidase [Aliiroseovarius sp.]|uniref:M23 family metallopeptidase n=1 Tax=Aliiroseovarius sp. TaxID=1872442 RepID=UPI003BABC233